MMHGPIYTFLYWVVRFGLFLYHPIFKVVGRKRVPKTGGCCSAAITAGWPTRSGW